MSFFILCVFCVFLFIRPNEFIEWIKIPKLMEIIGFFGVVSIYRRIQRGSHHALILGLAGTSFFGNLMLGDIGGVIGVVMMFVKIVILYLLTVNNITSIGRIKTFLIFFCLIGVFLSLNSLGEIRQVESYGDEPVYKTSFLGGVESLRRPVEGKDKDGNTVTSVTFQTRGAGIFNDPNDLGQILAFTILLSLGLLYFFYQTLFYWFFSLFVAIVCMVGIYYTNSRGTLVCVAAGIVYFFIRDTKKIYPKMLGGILLMIMFAFGPSRSANISASEGTDRLELWSAALGLYKRYPVFGVGVGNFQDMAGLGHTAHQSYLLALVEMGTIGFFFWFGLIIYFFRATTILRKEFSESENPEEQQFLNLVRITETSMVGYLVSAYFLSRTYQFPFYVLLGLGPALLGVGKRFKSNLTLFLTSDEWYFFAKVTGGAIIFLYAATLTMWRFAK